MIHRSATTGIRLVFPPIPHQTALGIWGSPEWVEGLRKKQPLSTALCYNPHVPPVSASRPVTSGYGHTMEGVVTTYMLVIYLCYIGHPHQCVIQRTEGYPTQ